MRGRYFDRSKVTNMTEKDLHKLRRHELLQLLLEQSEENAELRKQLAETEEQLHQLEATYERLRGRLDKKDMQIHGLRDTLAAQRHRREIELEEAGSIAEAALRLNGVFEAAQKAADQYLHNVQLIHDGKQPVKEEESEWEKIGDAGEEPFPAAQDVWTGLNEPAPEAEKEKSEPAAAEEELTPEAEEEKSEPAEEPTEAEPAEPEAIASENIEANASDDAEAISEEESPVTKKAEVQPEQPLPKEAKQKKAAGPAAEPTKHLQEARAEHRRRGFLGRKHKYPDKRSNTGGRA